MNYFYAIPWLVWIAWFVGWEAWGFKDSHDKWPTFSQLWKFWESIGEDGTKKLMSPGQEGFAEYRVARETALTVGYETVIVVPGGISQWSWFRWFTAIGIPIGAIVLEMHWVLGWF